MPRCSPHVCRPLRRQAGGAVPREQATRRLDTTGTGVLSVAQFAAVLEGLSFSVPAPLLRTLAARYGDGSGGVSCAAAAGTVLLGFGTS